MSTHHDRPGELPPNERRLDELLREGYRSIPVAVPELHTAVGERLRNLQRSRPCPAAAPADVADARAAPARQPTRRPAVRWGLRLYWLATAALAVVLVVRVGAVAPGPLTLLLGALAATSLLLGVRTVVRGTGQSIVDLVASSMREPAR